jgi:hypothetical protein
MYKDCSKAIRGQFNNMYPELEIEFERSTQEAAAVLLEEFNMMMENHTAKSTNLEGLGGGTCPDKVKLRNKFNDVFSKLREAWAEEAAEKAEEESEESEDEQVDISKFERDDDDDNDEEPLVVDSDEDDSDYEP